MSKFTKEPISLSSRAMSATERYVSQQTSSSQQQAAQALAELEARRNRQAQSLDQRQRKEARNQAKEYDFQSKLASNMYDVGKQGEFKSMRTAQDYNDSSVYASRIGSVQRIDDSVEYMEEAPYDTRSSHSHFGMMSRNPVEDLKSALKGSMIDKIHADIEKRASKARKERRLFDERSADNISSLFEEEGSLAGLSPSMLSPNSIARGGYERESASNFGIINQQQAMKRAAQVEQMRENHQSAVARIKREESGQRRDGQGGNFRRLETDDKTMREWENLEAQRGYSIQERYGQNTNTSLGDLNDIVF